METLVRAIHERRRKLTPARCLVVGISGIDASGKGVVSDRLAERLRADGFNVAVIHGDGWLHLPERRFSKSNPGEHFYRHAFRFDELFHHLVRPLRETRTVWHKANHTEETASHFRQKVYDLRDIDIAIVECVFLFQPYFEGEFDLRVWIECRFETALARAIARRQEGLGPDETIVAFEQIYFPAQRLHLERDDPKSRADIVYTNEVTIPGLGSS